MRADRLVATTLYLQRQGRTTAAELAEHLQVSRSTARRDLEALSAAGVPVYPQPGRGGGWQLVGGARTDLTGLTAPEVRALFLALGSVDTSAAGAALAKLVRALPEPFRDVAELAGSAQRVESTGWQRPHGEAPAAVAVLRRAILRRRGVTIGYRRPHEERAREIDVDPWRLVDKAGIHYLLAGTAQGPRTYRVDRMTAVSVLEDRVTVRPSEQDLDEQWRLAAQVSARARTAVSVRIRSDPHALSVLAEMFGTGFTGTDVDGEALVAAHTERAVAEQLAGWGSKVVVLDAPGVVSELRAIAQELLQLYPPVAAATR